MREAPATRLSPRSYHCAILEPDPNRTPGTSLAQLKRVRLTFDRGTVILTKDGEALDLATIPGVLWDARVPFALERRDRLVT